VTTADTVTAGGRERERERERKRERETTHRQNHFNILFHGIYITLNY
jgi:hypothetical protein